jgi:hypothetical protein
MKHWKQRMQLTITLTIPSKIDIKSSGTEISAATRIRKDSPQARRTPEGKSR